MIITVRELLENPHLNSTLIAGINGLNREITWVNSCELRDPSPWLTGGTNYDQWFRYTGG